MFGVDTIERTGLSIDADNSIKVMSSEEPESSNRKGFGILEKNVPNKRLLRFSDFIHSAIDRAKHSLRIKKSCRARTRSYDEKLEPQAVAKADSQIDSQALRDPDLARVVTAWPGLAPALKAAVLAITDSTKT